jgi:hypothetical protein
MMSVIVTHHTDDLSSGVVFVRNAASHHFPKQYTETVYIGWTLILPSPQNLRRHPMRSAHSNILIPLFILCGNPRQAEIT